MWIPRYVSFLGKYVRAYRTKEPRNVCVHDGTAERGSLSNQLNAEPTRWSLAILATLRQKELKPLHWDLLLVGVGVSTLASTKRFFFFPTTH